MKVWIRTYDVLPEEDTPVHTKVDDKDGCRHEKVLKRRGRKWYGRDDYMYVYYSPTHWMYAEAR